MASLNRIIILGKILTNPEARVSVEGMPVTKFSIQISSGFDEQKGTIEVVCVSKLAEICGQYLKKDSNVLVEGRIKVRSYEDTAGARKWVTEIAASNVQFLDEEKKAQEEVKAVSGAMPAGGQNESSFEEVEALPADDLPF